MNGNSTLRARWIVPIVGPPIENGWIEIVGGRIARVGRNPAASDVAGRSMLDLGDVAVLPGLVNAHTHLEFSDLKHPIGEPNVSLADWIVRVVATRQNSARQDSATRSESAAVSSQTVIARGAREAAESGTALIGEIATTPWPEPEPPVSSFLATEIISLAEVLGLSETRSTERFNLAVQHLRSRSDVPGRTGGISPHAPYSTPPDLIARCVDLAIDADCTLAMHVAESPDERELMQSGRGRFADNLAALGFDVAATFPWQAREPVSALIRMLAGAPSAMLIHGNDLRPAEIELLASTRSVSVIYCPRTHAFFGYHPHPVVELLAAGINVGLGTDSRASNPDLQLWREVRWLLNHRQDLPPQAVLPMATIGGAIAMRRDQDYGTLGPGRKAVLAVVPTTATKAASLYADFADSDASCLASSPDALHN